jgi:hypothetical protein
VTCRCTCHSDLKGLVSHRCACEPAVTRYRSPAVSDAELYVELVAKYRAQYAMFLKVADLILDGPNKKKVAA